jgi:hypothetical protein
MPAINLPLFVQLFMLSGVAHCNRRSSMQTRKKFQEYCGKMERVG